LKEYSKKGNVVQQIPRAGAGYVNDPEWFCLHACGNRVGGPPIGGKRDPFTIPVQQVQEPVTVSVTGMLSGLPWIVVLPLPFTVSIMVA